MTRLVAAKTGIKPGSRVIFDNAPESALELLGPPEIDGATDLQRHVDGIHCFSTIQEDLDVTFPR